ncbi:MAG: quinolinate synthase NadA [Promethearchaeati archaeon SRVP18_Atabeyarchaeia-1]
MHSSIRRADREFDGLRKELMELKSKKNAVILAHNYQRPEVQDVADFVGDSLGLSISASQTNCDLILFCGVDFMAETAKILNPEKKVLIPDQRSKCPMAMMLDVGTLLKAKRSHPDADVIMYINTHADVKAESDCICTSANAPEIVNHSNKDTVLFGPDVNLSYYVQKRTSKKIITVPERGICPTHHQISLEEVLLAKEENPDAIVLAHPECIPQIQDSADVIASTEGMIKFVKSSDKIKFIIATELGVIHRLEKESPARIFIPASEYAICPNMKMHTIEKMVNALKSEQPEILLAKTTMERAKVPVERMLTISAALEANKQRSQVP